MRLISVAFLDADDVRGLLRHPSADFPPATFAAVEDQIIELTRGQPYLVQVLAHHLVAQLEEGQQTVRSADIDTLLPKYLSDVETYFSNQLRGESAPAGTIGEEILTWLAQHEPATVATIHAAMAHTSTAEIDRALVRMRRRSILTRADDGSYRITIPLFARYIRQFVA